MENIKNFKRTILLSFMLIFISIFFWGCDGSSENDNVWVAFEKAKISMVVGEEQQLPIILTPADAGDMAYVLSSNNENVVRVSQDGTITAIATGTATITITSTKGANSANCVVTVLAEPVQLDTPTDISFDGDKIVWSRVQNKFGYKIILNGTELNRTYATNFFRDFEPGVENIIKIKAIGDNSAYLDSEWSEEFTFTVLNAPTISISNDRISFLSETTNAIFDVYLDGNIITSNTTISYILVDSNLTEGSHIYKIKQVGNPSANIYSSAFSNEIVVKKLSAPQNAVVSASVLTFDAVVGAQGYLMVLEDIETHARSTVNLTSNTYNFGDTYVAGKYNIKLISLGDSSTILNSSLSSSIAVDKLNAPSNITISNGVISWDRNTMARNGFLVNVYDLSNSQTVQIIPTAEYFYNFKENHTTAGAYKVTIIATGDNQNASVIRYINSAESEPLEITKLATPSNIMILDNKLVWDEVENCLGYEVIYNSQNIFTDTNSFELLNTDTLSFPATTLSLSVRAVGDEQSLITSETSQSVSCTKLGSLQRTDFSISQDRLIWNSVQNCMRYRVYVNNNDPVEVNTNYLDFTGENYNAIDFSVRVQPLSNTASYVMGEPSAEFTFQRLGTPTDLIVENGYLTWMAPSNSGVITSYRIMIGNYVYNTGNTYTQNDLHDYMIDGSTQSIRVQAICEDNTNQYMWGNFSNTITLTKLSSNFNAKIANGEYSWDRIENTTNYAINIRYLSGDQEITESMEYGANENRSIRLLDLDFFEESTTYFITIQALGTTGGQYLSSKVSPVISVVRLAPIQNLRLSSGVIIWDLDANVDRYELYVNGSYVKSLGKTNRLTLDETYIPGNYSIKIVARGDQTNTLNAKEMTEPLEVTKLGNNYNITTNIDSIMWDSISHASAYAYELRDPNNNIISSSEYLLNPQLSIASVEWFEYFYLKIKAIGNDIVYMNGDFAANGNDSYYIVRMLKYPTNLSIERGILSWDYVENTNDYKIIISGTSNGESVERIINYTKQDDLIRGSYNIANYISQTNLTGELRITIRSVGGQGVDAYLSSDYSDELRITKLEAPTLENVDGILTWNLIDDARQYKLSISSGGSEITKTFDGDTESYELDSSFSAGNYNITIQAIGDDIEYITSEPSPIFAGTKLSTPTMANNTIRVEGGNVAWNPISNVALYYVEVWKRNNDNTFSLHTTANLMPDSTLNTYLFPGAAGYYRVKIQSVGESGTRYLNSDIYDYENLLRKLSSPSAIHIENGVIVWNDVLPSTGYTIDFSGYKRTLGKVQSFEMSGFSSTQYSVSIQSIGDDTNLITSDFSSGYQVFKNRAAELELVNSIITWEKDYTIDYYQISVCNMVNNQVASINLTDINNNTFSLNGFDAGYYAVKVKYVTGTFDEYASIGYVTSEWSEEFLVYKLEQIQNFRLENNYTSVDPQDLEEVGSFSWNSVANATYYVLVCNKIHPTVPDFSFEVARSENIETLNYMFSDDVMSGDDGYNAYKMKLTAYNAGTIAYNNHDYNIVCSDECVIDTVKLPAPTGIYTQNANVYWEEPHIMATTNVEIEYILYWRYAELNSEIDDADDFNAVYIEKGFERLIQRENEDQELETVNLHNIPVVNGVGKYQFMVCAVGENCIRSTIAECEIYYNDDININTYCLFDNFESGKGTQANPYVIKTFTRGGKDRDTLSQLNFVNYLPNNCFLLQEDIALNSTFMPIGEIDLFAMPFNGIFDGNNQRITDGSMNSLGSAGLFSELKQDAVVKNLRIENFTISGSYNVIGFVTAENAGTIQNVIVKNCEVSSQYGNTSEVFEGGIAGKNSGTIKNCRTEVYLHAESQNNFLYVGGIAGYNEGIITQCTNRPLLDANLVNYENQISGTMVGGIAGLNLGETAQITECSNYATIYAYSNGGITGGYSYGFAGGIVGKNIFNISGNPQTTNYPVVENCYNRATVNAYDSTNLSHSKAGGIVGDISGGVISKCYNVGDISIIDIDGQSIRHDYAGALIGWNESQNSLANNLYYHSSNSQSYIPTSATALNALSTNISDVTLTYLMDTTISDKFQIVANDYQILLWEEA